MAVPALLAASGAAALVYEVVWFQLLELVIGSSAVSLAILLATFMGGMCLGSLLLPRLAAARHHPLRVYAVIEFAIGAIGLLVLFVMPLVGRFYTAWAGDGMRGLLLRALVAAACLLPPTALMGATLPAVARYVRRADPSEPAFHESAFHEPARASAALHHAASVGVLYAANIAGAVVGCLLAAFYLLRELDVATVTYVAVVINVTVGLGALALAALASREPDNAPLDALSVSAETDQPSRSAFAGIAAGRTEDAAVHLAIGLSGFCALGAQAIWTRILALLFGGSVYTFAIILAVFLVGLGVGSGIGALLCRTVERPRVAFAWMQMLAAAAIAWTAYALSSSLPYWPVNPSISSNIWFNFQLDLDRAFWALLPATLCWGASFPLAVASVAPRRDSARVVSTVYAANTLGAILGAIGPGLLLIAWSGSQRAQQLLIVTSAMGALVLFVPSANAASPRLFRRIFLGAEVAAIFLCVVALVAVVPPVSPWLIAHGRYAATWIGKGDILYAREGLSSSVAVSRFPNGALTYHVAGKIQASSVPRDMRLQRMLGHLSTLTPTSARSVAVVGCGAGVTAGAVSIDPRVERVTIVEIEPTVLHVASTYFGEQNFDVVHNPKVHVRVDDGRHYLLTTKERFDAITSDPLDPWVKGAANLYTREFLETLKSRLNPGGVVTLYVQLFETNTEAAKSLAATFFDAFPNGTMWGNTYEGRGHDMVLLGSVDPLRIDLDLLDERLARPEYDRVRQSLAEVGMSSALDLFSTYAGRLTDVHGWLTGAAINRDRNLRLQYLSGTALNLDESARIYAEMIERRRFPDDLFTGAAWRVNALRRAFQQSVQ